MKSKLSKTERINRVAQNRLTYVKDTDGLGRGLFAKEAFNPGDLVCVHSGEILPTNAEGWSEYDFVLDGDGDE
jgi:hypothetical protein